MSVEIRFEPDGPSGLVAEGAYLWDAAKQMGLRLLAECKGLGECDTCAVVVEKGTELLSAATGAEHKYLGAERLAAGERLACQAKIEQGGELLLRVAPEALQAEVVDKTASSLHKEFGALPLDRKVATLMELEAMTMSQALGMITNAPLSLGEKVLDLLAHKGRQIDRRKRQARRPPEHLRKGKK
jgi:ferredoxin